MVDPASKPPIGGVHGNAAAGQATSKPRQAGPEEAAGFKALLDDLERKAEALDAKTRAELEPDELAQAVDDARSSLEDVLRLQDRLLEAWRQSRHQPDGGGSK